MRVTAIGLAVLLAGCGGTNTSEAGGQNAASTAGEGSPDAQGTAGDCSKKPDFAPVYAGAKLAFCSAGPGVQPNHESGTVVYSVSADPKTVLGWSREQLNASGLGQRLATDTMYSAGESTKRSVMVIVEPEGAGTKVTMNWGRDL